MVHLQDTDDIIDPSIVDGDTGIARLQRRGNDLVGIIVDVQRQHIHAVGDDLARFGLVKFDGRLQKLAAILVDDALLLNGFDDGGDVLDGDAVVLLAAAPQAREHSDHFHENIHQRRGDDHQRTQQRRGRRCVAVTKLLGKLLGQDLAKNQQQNGHNARGDGNARVTHQRHGDHRGDRRGRDIDQIVADQDGAQGFVVVVADLYRPFGALVAFLSAALEAGLVDRGERDLRGGEKC